VVTTLPTWLKFTGSVSQLLLLLHPFNGLFSKTTSVCRHQKGKSFWILVEQEMMGWQWHWHQLNHNANHLHLAPDRKLCQYLITQFLQAGCPSCCPSTSIKELKAQLTASSQTLTWHTTDQSKLKQLTMTAYQ